MSGPDGGGGEQQAGQGAQPPAIDEALALGGERAGYLGREQEIAESLGDLSTQRTALQTSYEAELVRLKDQLNADQGKLGDQRTELEAERDTLNTKRGTAERKLKRLGGRIRALADRDGAARGDQLAFAAYATHDLSPAGLENISAVDELVQAEAGQLFVVSQGEQVAFGRIRPDNARLLINTDQERRGSIRRVHLPVQLYPVVGEDGTTEQPQYAWVAGGFDDEYREEYQYDSILGRGAEDAELLRSDSGQPPLSHFNLSATELYLPKPTKLHIAPADTDGQVFAKEALRSTGDDVIATGTTAETLLHVFIGNRMQEVHRKLGEDASDLAFSRAIRIARKLGIAIDLSRIASLESTTGESDS